MVLNFDGLSAFEKAMEWCKIKAKDKQMIRCMARRHGKFGSRISKRANLEGQTDSIITEENRGHYAHNSI